MLRYLAAYRHPVPALYVKFVIPVTVYMQKGWAIAGGNIKIHIGAMEVVRKAINFS